MAGHETAGGGFHMEQRVIQPDRLDRIVGGENVRKRYDENKIAGLSQSLTESGLR
jgi:hypothetical protein